MRKTCKFMSWENIIGYSLCPEKRFYAIKVMLIEYKFFIINDKKDTKINWQLSFKLSLQNLLWSFCAFYYHRRWMCLWAVITLGRIGCIRSFVASASDGVLRAQFLYEFKPPLPIMSPPFSLPLSVSGVIATVRGFVATKLLNCSNSAKLLNPQK